MRFKTLYLRLCDGKRERRGVKCLSVDVKSLYVLKMFRQAELIKAVILSIKAFKLSSAKSPVEKIA